MKIKNRKKLSYHPSYDDDVPCLLLGNKEIQRRYGWKVGDENATRREYTASDLGLELSGRSLCIVLNQIWSI